MKLASYVVVRKELIELTGARAPDAVAGWLRRRTANPLGFPCKFESLLLRDDNHRWCRACLFLSALIAFVRILPVVYVRVEACAEGLARKTTKLISIVTQGRFIDAQA